MIWGLEPHDKLRRQAKVSMNGRQATNLPSLVTQTAGRRQ